MIIVTITTEGVKRVTFSGGRTCMSDPIQVFWPVVQKHLQDLDVALKQEDRRITRRLLKRIGAGASLVGATA